MVLLSLLSVFFFFNDTATTEIYTLSLHDALPIFRSQPALIQLHNRQPRASFIPGLPTHIRLALHQHLGQSVAFNYLDGLGWLPSRKVEIIHCTGRFWTSSYQKTARPKTHKKLF